MNTSYQFVLEGESDAASAKFALDLADYLRQVEGVEDCRRSKANSETMDLGTIVTVIATSAATTAIAHGIADWLRARRGVKIVYEKNSSQGSLKTEVSGMDADAALRFTEIISRK